MRCPFGSLLKEQIQLSRQADAGDRGPEVTRVPKGYCQPTINAGGYPNWQPQASAKGG